MPGGAPVPLHRLEEMTFAKHVISFTVDYFGDDQTKMRYRNQQRMHLEVCAMRLEGG